MSFHSRLAAALFIAAGLIAVSTTAVPMAYGQETSSRHLRIKVAPKYPELARKMNVSGKVRLNVTVAPNGQVIGSEVLGGHPVLANAATDAVKKWKYEPASQESHITVEFDFGTLGG